MPKYGTGWRRDLPDIRDFHVSHNKPSTGQTVGVQGLLNRANFTLASRLKGLPLTSVPDIDLRNNMPPVFNQGTLGSCVFNAIAAQVEYLEQVSYGRHSDHSRLWGYKMGRDMLHWTGDTGMYLRTGFKVLRLLGLPEEDDWPYDISKFDVSPPLYTLGIAQNFKTISYFRLDTEGTSPDVLLAMAKQFIARKIPVSFGFSLYDNFSFTWPGGVMPMPTSQNKQVGGHAVLASGDFPSQQALLIRNSWGANWGFPIGGYNSAGYFFMPYDFILAGQTADWWVCLKVEWLDTGAFS